MEDKNKAKNLGLVFLAVSVVVWCVWWFIHLKDA